MNKQDFIDAMMEFAEDKWGGWGGKIPSNKESFAEVFDVVIVGLLKQSGEKDVEPM
jgi:hypothetical protein